MTRTRTCSLYTGPQNHIHLERRCLHNQGLPMVLRRPWFGNSKVVPLSVHLDLYLDKWPVIDLNRLNTCLLIERFKMETPESIRATLFPKEWVSSMDLSDTYLHIPIHQNSRKYLRFCHNSQVFLFTSLPFCLATAPQVFTMIVKEVKLMALTRAVRFQQYLDD